MKRRHMLLAAGVAIAAWLALFGDKTPSTGIAEPVARGKASAVALPGANSPASARLPAAATTIGKNERTIAIMAMRPRDELVGNAGASKRDAGLFAGQSWTPPPPPPEKPPPPPPPTAPALPFTYLGKKIEDGIWEVYLGRADQTFIVREHSVIEDTYRVESIKPPTITLTYLPMQQAQALTIGDID